MQVFCREMEATRLCDELDNTTGLLDLLLGLGRDVSSANDERNSRETALSEDLGVTERKQVKNRSGLAALLAQVLLTLLSGEERPELKRENECQPEEDLVRG